MQAESSDGPITIQITRTVREPHIAAFEQALREFVPQSLTYCGHMGVHVEALAGNRSRNYFVVLKFESRSKWEQFQEWPPYVEWKERIRPLLAEEPKIAVQSGLESWFALPAEKTIAVMPKWKMSIATFVGVYPTSAFLAFVLNRHLEGLHVLIRSFIFSGAMVLLLAYVVMPIVTRLLHHWLHAAPRADPASERTTA